MKMVVDEIEFDGWWGHETLDRIGYRLLIREQRPEGIEEA